MQLQCILNTYNRIISAVFSGQLRTAEIKITEYLATSVGFCAIADHYVKQMFDVEISPPFMYMFRGEDISVIY